MKNIAFIVNPISGTQNKKRIPKLIDKNLDRHIWAANVVFTEYKGHATELAEQYSRMGFDAVVAVGGDGTVNEVARGLLFSKTALGIIPIGSGNGFARHLGIPLRVNRAIQMLNHSEARLVDSAKIEGHPFFTTAGTGFDAKISEDFATAGKRGIITYLQHIVKDFFSYEPEHYIIRGIGQNDEPVELETDAFLITCANANQWGNAAYIAPKASIQDGWLDVSVLSKFPLHAVPELALRLFEKTIDKSLYMTTMKIRQLTIVRPQEGPFHFDGDPITLPAEVSIEVVPDSLYVLAEKQY